MGSPIFSIISAFCILQYIIFAILIIRKKEGNLNANIFLFLFLIVYCITEFSFFSLSSGLFKKISFLIHIEIPFYYLASPLFFLYIKSLTTFNFKLRKRDFIHFILFLIAYISSMPYFISDKYIKIVAFKNSHLMTLPIDIIIPMYISTLQSLFYSIYSLILLKKYRSRIKNNYSNISKINLSWLKYLIIIYLILNIFQFLAFTIVFITTKKHHTILQIGTIINTIWIIALAYKGLFQPQIFHGIKPINSMNKNKEIQFTDKKVENYINKINFIMEEEKIYLDPDINLHDLSKKIEIPRNYLSQIINNKFKCSFYDFLNKYRVDEVKKCLSDPKYENENLLTIALNAGFNCKATFNRAFKQYTSLSPSQYRKMITN